MQLQTKNFRLWHEPSLNIFFYLNGEIYIQNMISIFKNAICLGIITHMKSVFWGRGEGGGVWDGVPNTWNDVWRLQKKTTLNSKIVFSRHVWLKAVEKWVKSPHKHKKLPLNHRKEYIGRGLKTIKPSERGTLSSMISDFKVLQKNTLERKSGRKCPV